MFFLKEISMLFIPMANWTVKEVIQIPLSQCMSLGKSLGIDDFGVR